MKILSIDTSSKICSTAILENDKVMAEINLDDGKTHSENLMPMVAEILSQNNLTLADIELIACCVGPGSFTGIRIGVASVKAMAEVCGIPVVGVTSLEILAKMDVSPKTKVALIDARNDQVYCGIFDEKYQPKQDFLADDIKQVISVLESYEDLVCLGDGAVLHQEKLKQGLKNVQFSMENEQRASFGGQIAYQKFLQNDVQKPDTIVPLYLRKSQAERMKKK